MKAKITNPTKFSAMPTSRLVILMAWCSFSFFNTMIFAQGNGQYTLSPDDPSLIHGTSNKNGVTPFAPSKRNTRNQYLYLASELTDQFAGKGRITHLAFYVTALPGGAIAGKDLTMKNVSISIDSTATNLVPVTSTGPSSTVFQTIASLDIPASSIPGWVTFDITDNGTYPNGFLWDPAGANPNIFVEICVSGAKLIYPTQNFEVQTSTFSSGNYMNNGFIGNSNANATPSGCSMAAGVAGVTAAGNTERLIRPDVQFTFRCEGSPPGGDAKIAGSTFSPSYDAPINYCIGPASAPNYNDLVILGGSNASNIDYQWQKSYNGFFTTPINISSANSKTYTALKEDVDVWYRRRDYCNFSGSATYSGVIVIGADSWNGTNWTFEGVTSTEPDITHTAVFNGDFDSATDCSGDLEFCSVVVKSGTVTINSNDNLLVDHQVTVNGGNLIFDDSASLTQNSTSKTINSGNITFKRNTTKVRRYDYTYWSSPVMNQNLIAFSPVTRADKYYSWNHVTQTWDFAPPLTPIMAPGRGYIIRAPDNFAIAGAGVVWNGAFNGVPNNGNIEAWVSGTTDPDPLLVKWNLIGNPYPSSLDAFEFFDDNSTLLDGTFYVWTHNSTPSKSYSGTYTYNYNVNDYASFNKTGPSVGALPPDPEEVGFSPNYTVPDQYIASGQSFMIKGIQDGTPQKVIFKNTQRVKNNNSNFYKTRKNTSSKIGGNYELDRSRVWLEYVNEEGGFKQLLVGYLDGATNEYDNGYDGDIMQGEGVTFFSIIKDHQLGIQAKGLPFDNSDTIALGFTATVAGNNTIAMVNYDGLFKDQEVYIEDTYLNVIHNLKAGDYAFVTTQGTFLNRFVLRYTENALNLNPNPLIYNHILAFNKSGNLVVNSGNENIQSIKVYDLSGRLILQKNNCQTANVVFEKPNWNAQLVLVNITTNDNVTVTRKVLF